MAIARKQIGYSTEASLLWQILNQVTKLTTVIFGLKPKYKVFTVLLRQKSTAAPEGEVLDNTIGNITTSYRSEGQYDIMLPVEIPFTSKIFINNTLLKEGDVNTVFNRIINIDGSSDFTVQKGYYFLYTGNNNIRLYTISDIGVFTDSILINPICLEIKVYN